MKKNIIILLGFLVLPFGALVAVEVRVSAHVDSGQTIYVGSQFRYTITVHGAKQVDSIDVSSLEVYSPNLNRRESSNRFGRLSYTAGFSLLAVKAGTIKLPAVKVTVAGRDYMTQPLSVKVVAPARTDKFELELLVPKKKCYVGEPIEITLKWLFKRDVTITGAAFFSSFFSSDAFRIERVINEPRALKNRKGFEVLPLNGKKLPFAAKLVKRKGVEWVELAYSAVFVPRHVGNVLIEPSTVIAEVAVSVSPDYYSGRYKTERFMARSKRGELEVVPLPDAGRRKEAYGLVGNYTISASVAPTTVDVGEPITLTVKVGGSWLLKPVRRPEIENMDAFADNFKMSTQRDEPVVAGGEKIFTMTIRASNDSVTEVPSIPLVFFDTKKGEYVTAKSKPVPLKVNPSDVVTIGDVEFTGKGGINSHVEAIKKGVAANVVDIDLVSQEFSPIAALVSPGYLSLWGIPLAASVVSIIVSMLTNTSDAKVAASRRRGARKNAESMLKAAKSKQDVAAAMREYVGWRFGKSSGALTGMDCERIIAEAAGDVEMAKEYSVMFDKCEAAQYTGGGGACDRDEIESVINVISRIDKKS